MGEAKRRKKTDVIDLEAVVQALRVGSDSKTGQVLGAAALIKTAADESYVVEAWADDPQRALLALHEGSAARFVGRLSPAPNFPEFKGVIVSSAITPVERGEIVIVAAVEKIMRGRSDSGEITAARAYVVTKGQDRFTVSSTGGEPMRTLLALNVGDIARFTGRFSPQRGEVPNVELSRVTLIERSGRIDPWFEQWLFLSTHRLSPNFHRRVAGLRTQHCGCFGCGATIETADQIALVLLRDRDAAMVCADCSGLAREELLQKLSLAKGIELAPASRVNHAKRAECAIAVCRGLDPRATVSVDADWDYGLIEGSA